MVEKYILLITPCLPKVTKAEDQVAKWNSIHHGDKHQATYSKCSIFAELISYIYSKIFKQYR